MPSFFIPRQVRSLKYRSTSGQPIWSKFLSASPKVVFSPDANSIDRLGRNYNEILEQWRIITKEKGVAIVVLDMPLLDTRRSRDLTGTLIADIVLQLLSYVAQTEREFIHQRQAEGIAAAKARGVRFGRPLLEKPENFPAVRLAWQRKEISAREAARGLGVSPKTFLRWL